MEKYRFSDEQRKLLEGLSQPIAMFQYLDQRVVTVVLSDGFCDVFGYTDKEQAYYDMDNNMFKYTHPDDVARIADAAVRFATEGGTYEVIYRTRSRDRNEYRIIHSMGKHVYTEDGTRLSHIWYTDEGAVGEDDAGQRSELNRAFNSALHEESLVRESKYDFLTGLPNMSYFFDLATEGKKLIEERGEEPVLLYMDLCGMKYFNEQYSYVEGDSLLREFAAVLKDTFHDRNICRVGADHFAAYTEGAGLEERLERFFDSVKNINDGNSLPVRVGIYSAYLENVPPSTACDRAKFACDSMRNTYESCFAHYDSDLQDDVERRRYILANLDRAIDEEWIQVYYQPIVRAVNGRVCDEEALSRWLDPKHGLLSPADFIPVLEDAGMIYRLDLYVLEQVLKKMEKTKEMGLSVVPCSINLSRSDFTSCNIVEEVAKRVDASCFTRDMITIEITESTIGSDVEFMKQQVERFRGLGFSVWMDDFGSGYSSIDLLQSIEFDLIKFDMSFMNRLDESDQGKIVLTELIRMVTALEIDTLCEGVEEESQTRFLQEAGCTKLQGYYFCKPISFAGLIERYDKGKQIGFENPEETSYYKAIGKVNLFDLDVVAVEEDALQSYFDTIPMCVMEVGDSSKFIRTNRSYRDFAKRYFGFDISEQAEGYSSMPEGPGKTFMSIVRQCCEKGGGAFFDEKMQDGSTVHSYAKRISSNPVTGNVAVAVAVLSVTGADEGATYADIARALAADYYNIYYVDLDTEKFIEYSSQVGGEELAMERHGENFFESAKRDTMIRIYEDDRERFLAVFSKENVIQELDKQGVFTITYRLVDTGKPIYVNMKITRMRPGANQIIMGISIIDSQMKQQEVFLMMQRERDVFRSVAALSGSYLSVYSIDPSTNRYIQYNATDEYESLGIAKEGDDFFEQSIANVQKAVHPDDLPKFLEQFTKENILQEIEENGAFNLRYRLMIGGIPKEVSLRIASVEESGGTRLVAGVRFWQTRRS